MTTATSTNALPVWLQATDTALPMLPAAALKIIELASQDDVTILGLVEAVSRDPVLATRMLGASWPIVDEFYHFGTAPWDASRPKDNIDVLFGNHIPMGFSRGRVHVLLSLDTEKSNIANFPDVVRGGDYPQAWWRDYGKGRSFYTSLGHRDDIWSHDPVFRAHISGGIRWALGLED